MVGSTTGTNMVGMSQVPVVANSEAHPDIAGSAGAEAGKTVTETRSAEQQQVWNRIQSQMGEKPKVPRFAKKQLDKDDFLKIMVTQMKNQDPTKPFEAEKMAQEVAQITSVEQLQNINKTLERMSSRGQPGERMAMSNMLGKTVTVDLNRFSHDKGTTSLVAFNLPEEAGEVKVSLMSEKGEVVLEKDMGPQAAGMQSFNWDGNKRNMQPADTGRYMVQIQAQTKDGKPLQTKMQSIAQVIGVSFEGSEPVFLIGNAQQQKKVTLDNIIKIEDSAPLFAPQTAHAPVVGSPGKAEDAGLQAPGLQAVNKPAGGAFFTFEKGVGSKNVDPNDLSPEVAAAVAQLQQKPEQKAEQRPEPPVRAKGFPNGLDVYNQGPEKGSDTKTETEINTKGGEKT